MISEDLTLLSGANTHWREKMKSGKIVVLSFILVLMNPVYSQSIVNSQTKILKNVTKINVVNINRIIVNEKQDVLIVDHDNKYLGYDAVRETDFEKCRKLEATIYDLNGKKIKKLKKKDKASN